MAHEYVKIIKFLGLIPDGAALGKSLANFRFSTYADADRFASI